MALPNLAIDTPYSKEINDEYTYIANTNGH
jgi:hypothetical protein